METTDTPRHGGAYLQLAAALRHIDAPTITVLCGSTRFMADMREAEQALTWRGHIVLKPGCDMKTPHPLWSDPAEAADGKARLGDLHRAKIRLAHEVLIVGNYLGDSTRAEIAYARHLHKTVRFTHPEVDPQGQDEEQPCAR